MNDRLVINWDGKNYNLDEYRTPENGEVYLSGHGKVKRHTYPQAMKGIRAVLQLVPVVYNFGGILLKETGETRSIQEGEWYLGGTEESRYPIFRYEHRSSYCPFKVLVPVS